MTKRNLNYYQIYLIDVSNFVNKRPHLNYLNNQIYIIIKNNKNKDNKINEIYNIIFKNEVSNINKISLYSYLWKFLDDSIKDRYKKICEKIKNNEDYLNIIKEINNLFIDLYVDGSYRKTEKQYSYGFIIVKNMNIIYKKYDIKNEPEGCNLEHIAGELRSVIEGIKYVKWKKIEKVKLHYDFEGIADLALLSKCKPHNETTERYQKFIKNTIDKIDIVFIKIKSHSGNKYNEEVDKLCKTAFYKSKDKKKV
jgi:ribonuclease H-related protein